MRDLVDRLISGFDPAERHELAQEKTNISIWVLVEDKVRFEELQALTNKKFVKSLRQLLTDAIRRAHEKAEENSALP